MKNQKMKISTPSESRLGRSAMNHDWPVFSSLQPTPAAVSWLRIQP